MKSLHLTNAYHPTSGGVRTWYRQVLAAAAAEGWQARLVVPAERDAIERFDDHASIYHVRAPRAPVFDRRYRLLLPTRYVLPGGAVREILLQENPDLVEVGDKYALNWLAGVVRKGLVRGLKRPVLVGYSFERMDDNVRAYLGANGRLAEGFARSYLRWCYCPLFDVHLAASEYTAEELRAAAGPGAPLRVHVQPCGGLATDGFGPERRSVELRRSLLEATGGDGQTVLLLYAGRLSPEKNIALLPELMRQLAPGNFRLIVAGSGPSVDRLRQAAATLAPGHLLVRGHIQDRDELAALYATCDVFVHPNPREPLGIAPLEAMASGCPVVLPDRGGVLTFADGSNAWLAPPTGVDFAGAIRRLCASPDETRQRAARARVTAAAFDGRRMAHDLFVTYERICREFQQRTVDDA